MSDGVKWIDEVETMVGEDAMSSSIIPFPCYRVTRKSRQDVLYAL